MAIDSQVNGDRPFSIAIVGGGIGGLCTAIGLARRGVPFKIYEAAPAFAEIGAGVSLGPNAARAMSLIDPDVRQGFQRCATNNLSPEMQQVWFSLRNGQDHQSKTGTLICNVPCETGQTSVHRAKFLDELVALVPKENAVFGKRLADAEDLGDHVVLHFADGTTATHDALIGCDGVKSRARQILLGKDHPAAHATFSGKYAYRGLIPMDKAKELIGEDLAANAQGYFGRRGHLLTFPIEHGQIMNVVGFASKDGDWGSDQWVQPMDRQHMERDFEGWVDAVRQVLALMQKPDVWALFDHPSAPTYYKGRIALLGDAAHASTPHQGANAGQAIEDALCMSSVLSLVHSKEDLPKAFAAYDKVRRPRSQRQVKTAREAGMLYDLELPGVMDDMAKVKAQFPDRMRWIWEHDLEADVAEVQRIYGES